MKDSEKFNEFHILKDDSYMQQRLVSKEEFEKTMVGVSVNMNNVNQPAKRVIDLSGNYAMGVIGQRSSLPKATESDILFQFFACGSLTRPEMYAAVVILIQSVCSQLTFPDIVDLREDIDKMFAYQYNEENKRQVAVMLEKLMGGNKDER